MPNDNTQLDYLQRFLSEILDQIIVTPHDEAHTMLITMVGAIAAGVILIVLSRRLRISAIVLLLVGGYVMGPQVKGIVQPEVLGDGLRVIVSLAIGIILFEGGLTLDMRGYRSASTMIQRLLTVGMLTTWLSTTVAIWLFYRFDFSFALLGASLVIVTGPTVIAPLLKRIKLQSNLHSILHWEGVLIDPIGVFIAILCFEWIGAQSRELVLARFVLRFVFGLGLGFIGGLTIYYLIKLRLISEDMLNIFTLACAVLIFGIAEAFFSEAGLLAVTVAGFVVGFKRPGELQQIRRFKAEMTDLLIGTLFILLVARLELDQFYAFGVKGALLVAIVLLVARPLNILHSSWGLSLNWREKVFLSWVAPRGIVAASMASLFTLNLQREGSAPNAEFLETFTYSVIVATVLLQGFSAGLLATVLRLKRPVPTGWLIVGAHPLGRRIAAHITQSGHHVLLMDTNSEAIAEAQSEGLVALNADARESDLEEEDSFRDIGNLLALTDNESLNILLCQRWAGILGKERVFLWSSGQTPGAKIVGRSVWSNLPKPSLLSAELARGEAVLLQSENADQSDSDVAQPLLIAEPNQVLLAPTAQAKKKNRDAKAFLLLRRRAEYLISILHSDLALSLEVSSKEALFTQLVSQMALIAPNMPQEEIVQNLVEREKSFPTALGKGIAAPHAFCQGLETRLCALALLPRGLDFGALDSQPVRLVFLLLSPPDKPQIHLETLAEIARISDHDQTRERLLDATTEDLVPLIRNFDPSAQSF